MTVISQRYCIFSSVHKRVVNLYIALSNFHLYAARFETAVHLTDGYDISRVSLNSQDKNSDKIVQVES